MQNLSSYHNKKNGRGSSNHSEINGFKIFSFFGFTLITIHNKKNRRGCCKPSEIKVCMVLGFRDIFSFSSIHLKETNFYSNIPIIT